MNESLKRRVLRTGEALLKLVGNKWEHGGIQTKNYGACWKRQIFKKASGIVPSSCRFYSASFPREMRIAKRSYALYGAYLVLLQT